MLLSPVVFSPACNNISEQNFLDKTVFDNFKRPSFSDEQYCYKQNQRLSSVIYFETTNTLETKMGPLSSIIIHKYQTRYISIKYKDVKYN